MSTFAAPLKKLARGTAPAAGNDLTLTNDVWVPAEAKHPGQEIAYTEFTSDVNCTATTEGTANTVVTASTVEFDGKPVLVEFYAYYINKGTTNLSLWLYQDGSSIGRIGYSEAGRDPAFLVKRLSPSRGAHTYSVRGSVDAGTGTVGAGAGGNGANMPGFIRITRAAGGNS